MSDPLPSSEPDLPPLCPDCHSPRRWQIVEGWEADYGDIVEDPERFVRRRFPKLRAPFCDRCQASPSLLPGTLAWAYSLLCLSPGPDPADALILDSPVWAVAQFRVLMAQCYGLPDGPWYRPGGVRQLGSAWEHLLDDLVRAGKAPDPIAARMTPPVDAVSLREAKLRSRIAAQAIPLADVLAFLIAKIEGQNEVPRRLPSNTNVTPAVTIEPQAEPQAEPLAPVPPPESPAATRPVAPSPTPSPEITEADLEKSLRKDGAIVPALLVEFMMGKDSATAMDVSENVHDKKEDCASAKTIRGNCNRANKMAESLGCTIRYRFRGERVWKEDTGEAEKTCR